jgi:PAS domain S-box-containing protein
MHSLMRVKFSVWLLLISSIFFDTLSGAKNILLINSYHYEHNYPGTIVKSAKKSTGQYDMNLYPGYMDAKRIQNPVTSDFFKGKVLQPRLYNTSGKFNYGIKALTSYNYITVLLPGVFKLKNIPAKIYIKYKSEFIIALVSFVVMLGVIIQLLANISKRKKSELSLLQSEQKFKDIAEMLPQTIFESDMEGNLTFVNKQSLKMFGYTEEEYERGISINQIFSSEERDHIKTIFSNILEGKRNENPLFLSVNKNGNTCPFEVHINIFNKNGKPAGIRGIGIDITKQKETERQLIEAREKAEQSDKLKSSFLSNMSHEIRTPLNAIIGFSSLISDGGLNDEQKREYKKYIQNSSEYLLNLINDIIDHSRIEAGQLEIISTEFNLYELMKELYLNFQSQQKNRHKEHIQLVYKNLDTTDQIVILADPVRIKQVVANLLDNAFKFTDKGSIIFGYEQQNDDHILITVNDSGIGISEDDKPLVFKRFYKLCNDSDILYGGSGLGLSICKNLIGLMQGKIWLDSKKGDGTTFFIELPVKIKNYKQILSNPQLNDYATNYDWSNKTILVAEDEVSNFELVNAFLKNTKAQIIHALNGKEAVDISLSNPVDLILMDIQMPVLNGHEAIKKIRIHKPDIPIIAQTAYAMSGEKEEILRSGSNAYLAKPLDKIILLETINHLISQP